MKSSKLTFLDRKIITLLQARGFIKNEALNLLSCEVYNLSYRDRSKIREERKHFGEKHIDKIINNIIDIKRENYLLALLKQTNNVIAGQTVNELLAC